MEQTNEVSGEVAQPQTFAEYQKIDAVNWSSLKHIGRSPAHYVEAKSRPSKDTDALRLGRALHLAVFEPERFEQTVAIYSGRRAGKEWEAFQQANAGRELLTEAQGEQVLEMALAVRRDAVALPYVSGAQVEQVIRWTHKAPSFEALPGYEFACKARLDVISGRGVIADLKSTKDASPEAFARAVLAYEYHVQAAWYADGHAAANELAEPLPVVLVAVEKSPPYVVQVYRVPPEILALGRERYRALLDTLNHCRKNNTWPGYASGELTLELPRWAMPKEDDDAGDFGLTFGEG